MNKIDTILYGNNDEPNEDDGGEGNESDGGGSRHNIFTD